MMLSKLDIDNLIIENQKLIYKVIKDMNCIYKTEDEFQTLYDNGLEGLIKGAKTYDESKGKPSTWLYPCIKNEIIHYFTISNMKKRKNENGKDISIYEKVYNDNDSIVEIIDIIEDTNVNIEEDLEKKLEIERLYYAMDKALKPRDKKLICSSYGINGFPKKTTLELATEEKVSRTCINDHIRKSKKKLKEYLIKNKKEVFMLEKSKVMNSIEVDNEMKKNNINPIVSKGLNDYLFEQLENLTKKDVDLEKEIPKAKVVAQISQQIINNANTCLKAVRTIKEFEIEDQETLKFLGFKNVSK